MPRPAKPPTQLFLVTNTKDKLHRRTIKAGPKTKWYAYAANEVVYYLLSSKNAEYLEMARLWPVNLLPDTALEHDTLWGRWFFNKAVIGKPLELSSAAAWKRLVATTLENKPRTKNHDCALKWPALKGYTEPLRVLLDAGITAGKDDPLAAAAAFHQRATAKLLADHGYDVRKSLALMEKHKNDGAVKILRAL